MAAVGGQSEVEVGIDGVTTGVLEGIGLQLGDQADPAPLVAPQVDHHSPALGDDLGHRFVELRTTVTSVAAEDVTCQAFRVHPGQYGLGSTDIAVHQGDMLAVVDGDAIAVRREVAVGSGQAGLGHAHHVKLVAATVADERLDGDHRQAVLVDERAQLGASLHRAVVVDNLDQHPRRRESGEFGQVDSCLGVAAADQHTALAVTQREDVAGAGELPGLGR